MAADSSTSARTAPVRDHAERRLSSVEGLIWRATTGQHRIGHRRVADDGRITYKKVSRIRFKYHAVVS